MIDTLYDYLDSDGDGFVIDKITDEETGKETIRITNFSEYHWHGDVMVPIEMFK